MLCSFSSLSLLASLGGIYFAPLPNIFFFHLSFHHNRLLLNCLHVSQCLIFSSASSGSFSFHFYITYKVTCLQAAYFLPYYFFHLHHLCVIQALHLVKVISYCVDPVTALKIRNLFSCATVCLLITFRAAMREFL